MSLRSKLARPVCSGFFQSAPRLDGDFTNADKLGIYLQVYNLKPDEKTHSPMPLLCTP